MISDLDETLRQLLIQRTGLSPSEVDISFDIPTREWSAPVTRPTVNLYLYDVRENLKLREAGWAAVPGKGTTQARMRRRPLRVDLSYMVTCWTSATEDQHRLFWHVLETFLRHPLLPRELLQGDLKDAIHEVRLEAAQPEGVLKNLSDFWGALGNQLRPAINLVVTLDLDLNQLRQAPLVFSRTLRQGQLVLMPEQERPSLQTLELAPIQCGGLVRTRAGKALVGVPVRLLSTRDGAPTQVGPTAKTDTEGRFRFRAIPAGRYTLVVEAGSGLPHQRPLNLESEGGSGSVADFVIELEQAEG